MNEKEFAKNVEILKGIFRSAISETCYKFQEEFLNWNHLQEEFADEYDIQVFLQEIMDEHFEEIVEKGGILL